MKAPVEVPEASDSGQSWQKMGRGGGRKTLAQCLSDPYLESDREKVAKESGVDRAQSEAPHLPVNEKVDRTTRNRIEDTSSKVPLYKGTLWKLNTDGDAKE
ncbi:unnamed protein product [Effrenium voratum]|nr:unnamed protein product [Effrenium voratum]